MKPNLFIVGAAKAGTTSLYHYLKSHSEVYVSPIKEPNYFGKDIKWNYFRKENKENTRLDVNKYFSKKPLEQRHIAFIESEANYLKLFEGSEKFKVKAEFSTSYLYSSKAADEIYKFNPNSKIIIMLREPISRTISHYMMDFGSGKQKNNNILKALQEDYYSKRKGYGISNLYIELSLYYEQINRYIEIFPLNQILILRFEDLKKEPKFFLKKIFQFINVPDQTQLIDFNLKYNQTEIPTNGVINKMIGLKKIIPKSLYPFLKAQKHLFYKSSTNIEIPEKVNEFVKDVTNDNWQKCQQLIEKYSILR